MTTYIVHFCKNTQCNNAWLDEDLTKARKPPQWKYCEACVNQGFVNPAKPPVNPKLSRESKRKWEEGLIKRFR
jgi:hypothetical protein